MKKNNENLRELLIEFFDAKTASMMAEDFRAADNIFSSNPAPRPDPELLFNIKQNMYAAVEKKRQRSIRFIWQYAAAAAVVIIVFGASVTLLHKPAQQIETYMSFSIWQDASSSVENTIETQLADLDSSEHDSSLVTLEIGSGPEAAAITDIKTELDDIDATFWEG